MHVKIEFVLGHYQQLQLPQVQENSNSDYVARGYMLCSYLRCLLLTLFDQCGSLWVLAFCMATRLASFVIISSRSLSLMRLINNSKSTKIKNI